MDLSFFLVKVCGTMEEGQERDASPDDHTHVIYDNDDEHSPRDVPDL